MSLPIVFPFLLWQLAPPCQWQIATSSTLLLRHTGFKDIVFITIKSTERNDFYPRMLRTI